VASTDAKSAMSDTTTAYHPDQYADNYPPGIEQHWWTMARNEIVRGAVRSLPPSRILDVGCGAGLMVAYLRRHGMDCWGCELGSPEVRVAAKNFVWTNATAAALDRDFRQSVGIITLLDVLEHLPDPVSFLSELVAAYPAVHGVVVTVPARMELWTAWDDRYGHFLRYGRGQLVELYDKTDIEMKNIRYFFQTLYPALLLAARMNSRQTSINAPRIFWPHTMLAKWFVMETSIPGLGWMPGSSLIATGVPRRIRRPRARMN
jgi:SAM-dependent methyltransferase